MAHSSLITVLKVERAEWKRALDQARKEMQAFHREMAALGTIPIRTAGGASGGFPAGSRLPTLASGGGTAGFAAERQERQARRDMMREEVRDRLADFAQIRQLQRDKLRQEEQTGREVRAMVQREQRAREQARAKELSNLRADIQERARLEAQAAQQRANQMRAGNQAEERERERRRQADLRALRGDIQGRTARERQQAEENVRALGLPTRSQDAAARARADAERARQARAGSVAEERERQQRRAAELRTLRGDIEARAREDARLEQARRQAEARRAREARAAARDAGDAEAFLTAGARQGVRNFQREERLRQQAEREATREQRRVEVQRRFEQRDAIRFGRSVPITGIGGGGRFGGGTGGPGGTVNFDDFSRRARAGLEDTFKRATRAASELSLVLNVGVFGGLGAIVAEGFQVNSQFEKLNITMAATLGLTNDVVDAQGKLVEGPQRTNFLLQGTAGFYDLIRDIAAKTIVEQQDLVELTAENLALAQQAGFRFNKLSKEEVKPVIRTFANIGSLAKAIGLPGGERQLSQETRALLLGERLQGATIARLLQFNDTGEIRRLQQRRGVSGQSEFVEELGKRFAAVQPILDKFEKSAAGIFSALISQAREFLRIATESAFKKVTEVLGNVRDFLTADRVAASAQKVGDAIGSIVGGIIRLGQSPAAQFLFKLLSFMVENAATLISVFGAFKALGFIQGAGRLGGGGGLLGFLGGAGAAGVGAGVARGAGFVSPARGAAIEFASAAGTFGLGGALGRFGAQARGAAGIGQILGRPAAAAAALGLAPALTRGAAIAGGGQGLLAQLALSGPGQAFGTAVGAGALLGLNPATLGLLTAGAGLGIGTALDRFVLDPQVASTRGPGFGQAGGPALREAAAKISEIRSSQQAALQRARDLETRGAVARLGDPSGLAQLGQEELRKARRHPLGFVADVFTGALPARLVGAFTSGAREAPALTERVTAEALRRAAAARTGQIQNLRESGSRFGLRGREDQEREDEKKERLQALLSLAEVRRQREAAINIQAELDARAARKEITDQTALANALKAIRLKRVRDIKELREDEADSLKELQARALNDEEAAARIRVEREKREATRRIRDRRILAATLAAIDLQGQRDILEGRLGNIGRQSQGRARLAGARGDVFTGIVEQGRQELIEVARLRTQNLITDREFEQGRAATVEQTQENLKRKRREFFNEGVSLTMRFTDLVRESTRLQEDYELNLLAIKERIRERERALNRSRLAEVNSLVDAQRELREAQAGLNDLNQDQALRSAAFDAFRLGGQTSAAGFGIGTLEERVSAQLSRQGQRTGEFAGLSREQREGAVKEQTRTFLSGLFDALTGEGGLAEARRRLREIGVSPTRAEEGQLAGLPGRMADLRREREERSLLGQRVDAEGRVAAAAGGIAEARAQRVETERADRIARRQEVVDLRRLPEDFQAAQARLAVEFSNTKQAVADFAREISRAGYVLSQALVGPLSRALGISVPSPDLVAAQDATVAVSADRRSAATRGAAAAIAASAPAAVLERQRQARDSATRGSTEEFVRPDRASLFGKPGQPISDLGRLVFGAVPGGDVGPQVNDYLRLQFSSIRDQTVTAIPGINLNGMAVSKETARLLTGSGGKSPRVNLAESMAPALLPPFIGSRPEAKATLKAASPDQRSDAGGTVININGMNLGPDVKALFEQIAEKLRKEARVTATG